MKRIFPFFVLLFLFCQNASAKIWRVNNNTGVDADFKTVQAAVDAAAAGDTIYIEGSAASYDNVTVTKKIIIIGTGYFLSDVENIKTQWNTNPATLSGLTFDPGSKGSKISGMSLSTTYLNDSLITIERCYCNNYVYLANKASSFADHDTIRQSAIYGIISQVPTGKARGVMIYNNLLYGATGFSGNLSNTTAYFINNILSTSGVDCINCVFQNNIFYGSSFGSYGNSNYFANNIFVYSSQQTGVPVGNNNLFGVAINTVFIANFANFNNPQTGFSHDGQFQLAASSPAKNAGKLNGTQVDCGIYGGPAPYILSGIPNIPSIYSLTVPAQVNSGTPTISISLSSAAH